MFSKLCHKLLKMSPSQFGQEWVPSLIFWGFIIVCHCKIVTYMELWLSCFQLSSEKQPSSASSSEWHQWSPPFPRSFFCPSPAAEPVVLPPPVFRGANKTQNCGTLCRTPATLPGPNCSSSQRRGRAGTISKHWYFKASKDFPPITRWGNKASVWTEIESSLLLC